MGTRIESVATSCDVGHIRRRGALGLTDAAAIACLQRAGRDASELDLLINTGMFKDANTAEPALATIIQDDIGANVTAHEHEHATFSFDVVDGACGVLTAARIAASFVNHGTAKRAMIVAGDVDPSKRTSRHFPFAPAAGAVLLGHTTDRCGFEAFTSRTFPEYANLFEITLRWKEHAGLLRRGRNVIDVHEDPEFALRCTDLATDVVLSFLDARGLWADDIDLLITSQYPRRTALELGHRLGIPATRIPIVPTELALAHTAGPLAGLESAFTSGQLARAQRTLFVTVGAGITIVAALYRTC